MCSSVCVVVVSLIALSNSAVLYPLSSSPTMGKNKNKGINSQAWNQVVDEKEEHNNGNGANEEQKSNKSKGVIVLGVYLHCQGCADLIIKSLRGFDGVEIIETDMANHKVVVKGKDADPIKVTEWLQKRSGKHVELISPIPPKNQKEKKEEKKSEPKVVEVLLKVYLHCQGCANDIKARLHKMSGVQTVEPDMATSQVKVKGTFEPKELVEYVIKRVGKNAEILKVTGGKQQEDKKEDHDKKEGGKATKDLVPYPHFPSDLVYAPQLFSDENPNACSIM